MTEKKEKKKKKELVFNTGAVIFDVGSTTRNKTGSWRIFRPVIDQAKCIKCGNCWMNCPDTAVKKQGDKFVVDLDFCKGCGLCAKNCPVKCIEMVLEER